MRSNAREAAFKIIYAEQFNQQSYDDTFKAEVLKKAELNEEERRFTVRLVRLVEDHREELTEMLNQHVVRFADYRIYPVDRSILLIALAEIKYVDEVPPIVSVNEAVGLARKYASENSPSFVNGVLAGVINS